MREPNFEVIRRAKMQEFSGNINQKMFIDFFKQEVSLRERRGKVIIAGPAVEVKYAKLLTKVAMLIWQTAIDAKVDCINLLFIFLNRYYAFFVKSNPITKIGYYWEEFVIELTHSADILSLLNYDDKKREFICGLIQEFREAKSAESFKTFVLGYADGYKVRLPEHDRERSRLFETFLIMLQQLESNKLDYFLQHHCIEILKAHVWGLKQFGNPIKIHLGNLVGDQAMSRLKKYIDTFVVRQQGKNSFGGLQGAEF